MVIRTGHALRALFVAVLAATCGPAYAKTVAYDVEIVIDQVLPGSPFKIGDIHRARIFYEDSSFDEKDKRVPLLHLQHMRPLVPLHLDPIGMPMGNSFLDLSGPVIAFHYAAAPPPAPGQDQTAVLFDEKTRRFTARRLSDGVLTLAGPYRVLPDPLTGPEIDAAITPEPLTGLDLTETITFVAPPLQRVKVGEVHRFRLIYDPAELDPDTKTVKVIGFYELRNGKFGDPLPVNGARLDLSTRPYSFITDIRMSHAHPVDVFFQRHGRRTVVDHASGKLMVDTRYTIDPTPVQMDAATAPLALDYTTRWAQGGPAAGAGP